MTNFNYGQVISNPPQTEPVVGHNMAQNNAGGYTFVVDKWTQLRRFLILGTESGSYYATPQAMTIKATDNLLNCISEDGIRVVNTCIEISDGGLAKKNDSAILVMALCGSYGDKDTKSYALRSLKRVCRTSTHLIQFTDYIQNFRGWGRGLRNAVADWYDSTPIDKLVYQGIKYQGRKTGNQRWTHRDLLRLSHPKTNDPVRNELYKILAAKDELPQITHNQLERFQVVESLPQLPVKQVRDLIIAHRLPREVVPTQMLNDASIWEALLEDMPMTAMIRNLGKMTAVGLIAPLSQATTIVSSRLRNEEALQRARVHPMSLLQAMRVYSNGGAATNYGRTDRAKLTWKAVQPVIDALDDGFYLSFKNVPTTNKSYLLGLDVSGSMTCGSVLGMEGITPREATACMALCTAKAEPRHMIYAFTDKFIEFEVSPNWRLDQVLKKMSGCKFGRTDCSQPMIYALDNKLDVDTFVIYTDNETWAGKIHPFKALQNYRKFAGKPTRLIVVATSATEFSIADPTDPGMLDVAGFDASAPRIIGEFSMGNI